MLTSNPVMPTLQHILFPYDFSPQGHQVAPFVRAIAGRFGARVTVISAVPPAFGPVPAAMDWPDLRIGEDSERWRRTLQARLDQALVDELAGIETARVAVGGDPALRIADFARTESVDLIMMPTHGLGTFRRLLIGSVTSKVLHDATCPVWTAAHADTQTAAALPRRIVCAVDGSPSTPALARWAVEFAGAVNAHLQFLHVVGPISDWPTLESERRLQEQVREDARGRITAMLKSAGIEVPLRVVLGQIVQTAVEEARQEAADLMIIGRGAVSEPFGRLRTHAFGIIQRSPCPVLSV